MKLVEQYGTPLKFTYLPQISNNINKAKSWFRKSMEKTSMRQILLLLLHKSSHFEYIMNEAFKTTFILKHHLLLILILLNLLANGKINKHLCDMQWFQRDQYIENIARLINTGHKNTIPIIDNFEELDLLQGQIKNKFKIEFVSLKPKFEFYTSRLGIGYKNIVPFYKRDQRK
jgi:arginine decarboxylase